VLDAYASAGGNFLDTADVYSAWVPGHTGGESEQVIGNWMAARGNRDSIVVATKVGYDRKLSREAILTGAERSLKRLQTDRIDLYYAHNDDPDTPYEESLGAFGELIAAGKVREIGLSNISGDRLTEALNVAEREGLPRPAVVQNEYNLLSRGYAAAVGPIVAARGLACVPYSALASGLLTGKYRPGGPTVDSPRAQGALAGLDDRGLAVLGALDAVAAAHAISNAAVALAWLAAQETVTAPIASARSTEQLEELLAFTSLELSADELDTLDRAG
jgi:aryl-alcohol dehydrogenase-like predicted oxidoreductase